MCLRTVFSTRQSHGHAYEVEVVQGSSDESSWNSNVLYDIFERGSRNERAFNLRDFFLELKQKMVRDLNGS